MRTACTSVPLTVPRRREDNARTHEESAIEGLDPGSSGCTEEKVGTFVRKHREDAAAMNGNRGEMPVLPEPSYGMEENRWEDTT